MNRRATRNCVYARIVHNSPPTDNDMSYRCLIAVSSYEWTNGTGLTSKSLVSARYKITDDPRCAYISHIMNFLGLAKTLGEHPQLSASLSYEDVVRYIDLLRCLKPTIALQRPSYDSSPPDSLTANVHEFLKVCLDISDDTAKLAWTSLRELAWTSPVTEVEADALRYKYIKLFMQHGLSRGICELYLKFCISRNSRSISTGPFNILPPTRICIDPKCRQQLLASEHEHRERKLTEPLSHPITIFTRLFGAVPGFATSLYCRRE